MTSIFTLDNSLLILMRITGNTSGLKNAIQRWLGTVILLVVFIKKQYCWDTPLHFLLKYMFLSHNIPFVYYMAYGKDTEV